MSHAEVIEGGSSFGQAILIEESSPRITHSTISGSHNYGIFVKHGGSPEIDHNTISHSNSSAIFYGETSGKSGDINIYDNSVDHNYGSAAIFINPNSSTTATSLGENTLTENGSLEAIYFQNEEGEVPPDIGNNTLTSNYGNHIWVSGIFEKSGTWSNHSGSIFISSLTVEKEVTLTVKAGMVFEGGEIVVKGTFNTEGTAEEPVVFERQSPVSEYAGLVFKPGSSSSVLSHAEIIEGGYWGKQAILIEESSPRITHSTIRKSTTYGIFVKHGGSPEIDHNTISHSNSSAIFYGETSGKSGDINIYDNSVDHNYGSAAIFINGNSSTSTTTLGDNTLTENSSTEALYFDSEGEVPADIGNNTVTSNTNNHIDISGVIGKSALWEAHPVEIYVGSLEIAEGATLTIEAGAVFHGGTFTIKGTLKAEGTTEEPVAFKPKEGSTWGGLTFEPGSGSSVLEYAEIVKGGKWSGAAITINESSPTITHSTIREGESYGIFVKHGGAPEINHNTVTNCAGIFHGETSGNPGDINIHNNYLARDWSGIYINANSSTTATSLGENTLIENVAWQTLYFSSEGEVPPDIDTNWLKGNESNYINVSGSLDYSTTSSDHGVPIVIGTLVIAEGTTLTVEPGLAFEAGTFTINGTLDVEGSEEEPVVFQPREGSKWQGLLFEPSSGSSVLNHAEIVQGGNWGGTAITIKESSPTITHSAIQESSYEGVLVKQGAPTIEWDVFHGNPYDVVYEGEGKLSAHDTWSCESVSGCVVSV